MRTYALERDIERLQSRLTSVEEDYADAEKSLEAVRADLRAAEGRVEELEAKCLAAESGAARLEEKAKKTLPLLCFAFGFIGSIVKCKDARFATSLPHLAQWTEEAGAAIAAEEGK